MDSWHLFWTYFTAVTIMAAGVSIVFRKYAQLAATLLGIQIFLFCARASLFWLSPPASQSIREPARQRCCWDG
jgi:hypothetical protein